MDASIHHGTWVCIHELTDLLNYLGSFEMIINSYIQSYKFIINIFSYLYNHTGFAINISCQGEFLY